MSLEQGISWRIVRALQSCLTCSLAVFRCVVRQLFSIGLVKLNMDGTPKLDESGNTMLAYTNDDIVSFARAWTGFDRHARRANYEDNTWSGNNVDPMRIEAQWRDRFPKTDLTGGGLIVVQCVCLVVLMSP